MIHPQRSLPTMKIPAYLIPLLSLFAAHGERAYPVGGCVRDTLMGIRPHDWDVAVTTAPDRTVLLCKEAGYRTIPTGIQHGTVTVLLPHSGDPADREGSYELIECTTCRTEGGYSDGRHPDAVAFTGRISDDLSRRDFTVNAMALDTEGDTLTVLDLFGGREDLENGIIRAVGDPDTRFTEDALRLMRAVRFAVKLGFSIEPQTRAAMARCADGLGRISRERISEEFQKILLSPDPEGGVAMLAELGLMPHVLPEGISPAGMGRLSELPADFAVRMAALQWGKDGERLRKNLTGLRLSNAVRKSILTLADSAVLTEEATPRNARIWRHSLGDLAVPAVLVRLAHVAGDQAALRELLAQIRASEERGDPVRVADLAIGGNDLIALGFRPGRLLQDILCELLEVVWSTPEKNTREALIQEALKRQS
jgi:tRNA nucleotidyltransferase (CCA-adding enzyme)